MTSPTTTSQRVTRLHYGVYTGSAEHDDHRRGLPMSETILDDLPVQLESEAENSRVQSSTLRVNGVQVWPEVKP